MSSRTLQAAQTLYTTEVTVIGRISPGPSPSPFGRADTTPVAKLSGHLPLSSMSRKKSHKRCRSCVGHWRNSATRHPLTPPIFFNTSLRSSTVRMCLGMGCGRGKCRPYRAAKSSQLGLGMEAYIENVSFQCSWSIVSILPASPVKVPSASSMRGMPPFWASLQKS